MIIDKDGNILQAWFRAKGPVVYDTDNEYGIDFTIAIPYTEEQAECWAQIKECKKQLKATDYKALKYADGAYTEEEYEPIRTQRAEWRARINEIQETYTEPTLTRAEIDEAEKLAMNKFKA